MESSACPCSWEDTAFWKGKGGRLSCICIVSEPNKSYPPSFVKELNVNQMTPSDVSHEHRWGSILCQTNWLPRTTLGFAGSIWHPGVQNVWSSTFQARSPLLLAFFRAVQVHHATKQLELRALSLHLQCLLCSSFSDPPWCLPTFSACMLVSSFSPSVNLISPISTYQCSVLGWVSKNIHHQPAWLAWISSLNLLNRHFCFYGCILKKLNLEQFRRLQLWNHLHFLNVNYKPIS